MIVSEVMTKSLVSCFFFIFLTHSVDFTEARDSEWQWHHLGHMQVCTLLQTDNHNSTLPLSFLQAGCPSCHPTNSVKALKAQDMYYDINAKKNAARYSRLV